MVSKNAKTKSKYIRTPFAVLIQGKDKANKLICISKQEALQLVKLLFLEIR